MENFNEQREIVIRPKSIKIENSTLPENICRSETSPFEDGYDYYAEDARLEASRISGLMSAEDHNAISILEERKRMLQEAIYRRDFFSRRTHVIAEDIDLSEIKIIAHNPEVGKLRNQQRPDSLYVHINRSAWVWFGRKNGEQKRSIGLRSAAVNLSQLTRQAGNGNFYAEAALMQAEKDLIQLENSIKFATQELAKIFLEYRKKGISVELLASENPRKIEMIMNRYGGKLALILVAYDNYQRMFITLQNKGLLSNNQNKADGNLLIEIDNFCEKTNEITENLQIISNINRHQLLNNENGIIEKLRQATAEDCLPTLPLSVLTYEQSPSMLNLQKTLNEAEIEQLKQIAIENKLISEV